MIQQCKELEVEFLNGQGHAEKKKFSFKDSTLEVQAGALKHGLLNQFDQRSPVLEQEGIADENQSYHLLGIDSKGKRAAFPDEATVNLEEFSHFLLAPRTTGGGRRLGP